MRTPASAPTGAASTSSPAISNPERIFLSNAIVAAIPVANVGDSLPGSIVGVMDYTFGNFKLVVTAPLPALDATGAARETVSFLPVGPADIDVAAFAGSMLEGMGKLFANNVKMYAYPMPRAAVTEALGSGPNRVRIADSKSALVGADDLILEPPSHHLYRYLRDAGRIVQIEEGEARSEA